MANVSRSLFAVAALLVVGCSGSGSSAPPGAVERIVFTDGINVHLATFDGTHLTTIASASIPSAGLLAGHTIFGLMKHPTQPWLFASSLNECQAGTDWCWGNGRIDRFVIGQNSISWAGLAFDYTVPDSRLGCTTETSGYAGQVGNCAPVNGTFSADGKRLYMKDDDNDDFLIFGFEPSNALTLLWVSANNTTDLHGMAIDPTGASTYVYQGTNAWTVAGDVGVLGNSGSGSGGNSTVYVPMPGDDLLLSTQGTGSFGMFSLADPADPQMVSTGSTVTLANNQARGIAMSAALNRVIVVGQNSVKTFGWSGGAFTPEASFDPHQASTNVENRNVALFSGDTKAAVSFFQKDPTTASGVSGGVSVYGIDPTGAITTLGTLKLPAESRVVKALKL